MEAFKLPKHFIDAYLSVKYGTAAKQKCVFGQSKAFVR